MIEAVEKHYRVTQWAREVINDEAFVLLGGPEEYEYIQGTVGEVTGSDKIVTTMQLYEAMLALGFCKAPHESACALREVYMDQPNNEYRYVLSEPVVVAYGGPGLLRLERDSGGFWVGGYYALPDDRWNPGARLWLCRKSQ